MLRAVVVLGVLFTCLVPAGFSHADLIFEFAVGGTPQTAIDIAGVGGTVPIQVYLSQTGGETILTTDGLALAGIRVSFGSPGGIAAVQAVSDITPAFVFPISIAVTPTTADLDQETDVTAELYAFPDANGRILLGTFTFTGLTLGTTTIGVTDLDPGSDNILTRFGEPLDSSITPGTATLTVTPEPGSVALSLLVVGAASVVTSYRARRQRKSQAANAGGSGAAASL